MGLGGLLLLLPNDDNKTKHSMGDSSSVEVIKMTL